MSLIPDYSSPPLPVQQGRMFTEAREIWREPAPPHRLLAGDVALDGEAWAELVSAAGDLRLPAARRPGFVLFILAGHARHALPMVPGDVPGAFALLPDVTHAYIIADHFAAAVRNVWADEAARKAIHWMFTDRLQVAADGARLAMELQGALCERDLAIAVNVLERQGKVSEALATLEQVRAELGEPFAGRVTQCAAALRNPRRYGLKIWSSGPLVRREPGATSGTWEDLPDAPRVAGTRTLPPVPFEQVRDMRTRWSGEAAVGEVAAVVAFDAWFATRLPHGFGRGGSFAECHPLTAARQQAILDLATPVWLLALTNLYLGTGRELPAEAKHRRPHAFGYCNADGLQVGRAAATHVGWNIPEELAGPRSIVCPTCGGATGPCAQCGGKGSCALTTKACRTCYDPVPSYDGVEDPCPRCPEATFT